MSKTSEMNSIAAVSRFIEANNLRNVGGPKVIFQGIVNYESSFISLSALAEVHIDTSTYSYGDIELLSDKIDPQTVHAGFSCKYQDMLYDAGFNRLIIRGNSPKMSGKYTVSITIV